MSSCNHELIKNPQSWEWCRDIKIPRGDYPDALSSWGSLHHSPSSPHAQNTESERSGTCTTHTETKDRNNPPTTTGPSKNLGLEHDKPWWRKVILRHSGSQDDLTRQTMAKQENGTHIPSPTYTPTLKYDYSWNHVTNMNTVLKGLQPITMKWISVHKPHGVAQRSCDQHNHNHPPHRWVTRYTPKHVPQQSHISTNITWTFQSISYVMGYGYIMSQSIRLV